MVEDGDMAYVSVPRGGPIYIPDVVGPRITVSEFETAVQYELQDLEDICKDSVDACHHDFSVDELKILTEEELVNKAFELSFENNEVTENSSQLSKEQPDTGKEANTEKEVSGTEDTCFEGAEIAIPSHDSSEVSQLRIDDEKQMNDGLPKKRKRGKHAPVNNKPKKRKRGRRVSVKNDALEEVYITKVKQLARIKQKQEEDKASARLHSFNGSCNTVSRERIPAEKEEQAISFKTTSASVKVRVSNACDHIPMLYPESVLCVEIYSSRKKWVKTQELLVLARQPLSDIKDKIYCLSDEIMEKSGQHDPSGYFLIEDVFCNDLRDPSASDYSKPIFNWLKDSRKSSLEKWEYITSGELQQKQREPLAGGNVPELPEFKSVQMHKTRFLDLRFKLGAGYLYCHQGDCKHSIVIRDMRLIHPEDVENRASYPVVTFQLKLRFQKCSVCKIYRANKVTVDDKWAPKNPCYFCDICYYMLHYVDGNLLYTDFSVYDYLHD